MLHVTPSSASKFLKCLLVYWAYSTGRRNTFNEVSLNPAAAQNPKKEWQISSVHTFVPTTT
jgi:hypothetical protein